MSTVRFQDRRDAGQRLAALLEPLHDEQPVIVGIPRGGVPVAAEVARMLGAPLDVVVVRKIGAPQNPEFAIGALAEGGIEVLSERTVRALGLSEPQLRALIARVEGELVDRHLRYRGPRGPAHLGGRTVILVDDGLATGHSALAAVRSLCERGASSVMLAVPVAAPGSAQGLRWYADEVVCVEEPAELRAVGYWYEDFRPTTDEEVTALLAEYGESSRQPDPAAVPLARVAGVCAPAEPAVATPCGANSLCRCASRSPAWRPTGANGNPGGSTAASPRRPTT